MRVVLDTNVVLSALLFSRSRVAWLRDLWVAGRVVALSSRATIHELIRVLAYPKFQLSGEDVEILLGAYLPYTELVRVERKRVPRLPRCADEKDQMFLTLAAIGRAEVLVTGDRALLKLAGRTPFDIETPGRFKARLL